MSIVKPQMRTPEGSPWTSTALSRIGIDNRAEHVM
jgi:hypothetical protein